MKRITTFLIVAIISAFGVTMGIVRAEESSNPCDTSKEPYCFTPGLIARPASLSTTLDGATMPKLATPAWMTAAPASQGRAVNYTIATKGTVQTPTENFAAQVAETLNSPLGWSRLGVRFVRVETGGEFTVWLSQDSQVPSFSPSGCDAIVSCTVGNNVIINETRWLNGSDAWNGAGGSLRDYRHMVLNHETGHWLGHGHQYCSAAGQQAAVMQQQTINMQGCAPNPWPLQSEMYSPRLGIRS